MPEDQPASIALLPGSFDPLTVGHAAMARAAAEQAALVVLVYSVRTLPKEGSALPPLLGETERLIALARFCAARGYSVGLCSHGLLVEQVEAAEEGFPGSELILVVGSDKLLQVLDPRWYDDVEAALTGLFDRASVALAMRAGDGEAVVQELANPAIARWVSRIRPLDVPPDVAAVSSRDVRERIARGEIVSELVPEEFLEALRPR
jgi:nicotinamide-nucleotide adenylyltransferase